MMRIPTAALLVAAFAAQAPAIAQHEQHAAPATSEKLGTVQFETSCNRSVRSDFNRAVALLHSFEFGRSLAAFEAVLANDADCAMAHWGVALSHWGNPFGGVRSAAALERGFAAIDRARSSLSPTARERGYIEAAAELFEDHAAVSQRDRILAYERAMRRVARENPHDDEAAIFHALAVNQTALPTDKTYARQLEAARILEPLVGKYPDHPGLTHYIIHAYDHPPLASRALDAARRYAEIAPSAAHALHMPSHTFTRMGLWKESAETNRRSEQAAIEQGSVTEALHAMDYQAYAYLQMAEDQEARKLLTRLKSVAAGFDPDAIGGAAPAMAGYFAMVAIPARFALERGDWLEAARLAVPRQGPPVTIAMAHFARAIGAARMGDPSAAEPELDRLSDLHDRLNSADDAYWAEQLDIQRRVAAAWTAFAEGRRIEALRTLRAAAEAEDATDKSAMTPGPLVPARESLAEMLLEAGNARAALAEFEASLAKEPGRFRGLFGAGLAAETAGDHATARRYFRIMLENARGADSARAGLRHARSYLLQD
ncbi:MAG: hypothetical protein JXB36_18680 [Gammaproteobacteria bacterium]|nr:hypothetical protein [Gammaproteobacteria bacterium]